MTALIESGESVRRDESTPKQTGLALKRGTVWLVRFEGIVLHSDRDQQTQLNASGGGGYVGPQGGYVAAPRITSTTREQQTVFARGADGVEKRFDWNQWTLPVRPGSRIAVLWGARTGSTSGPFIGTHNLDTGDERWAFDAWLTSQRLVTVRVKDWLCLLLSLVLAAALVGGFANKQLRELPRPEQRALDQALIQLDDVMRGSRGFAEDKLYMGRFQQANAPGSPQRIAAARERVALAKAAVRQTAGTPYDSRPAMREVLDSVMTDGAYQAAFYGIWALASIVTYVIAAIVAAISTERGGEDGQTEERLRRFLRTRVMSGALGKCL